MSEVLLITGGGRGILRDAAAAEAVACDVRALGMRAIAVQADVAHEAEVQRLFESVDRELGRIDVRCPSVGCAGRTAGSIPRYHWGFERRLVA